MRKYLIILIVVCCFFSCSKEEQTFQVVSGNWQDEINALNDYYRSKAHGQLSWSNMGPDKRFANEDKEGDEDENEKEDQEKLKVDLWEVANNDVLGLEQGAIIGSRFGHLGIVIGGVVAAAVLSTTSYIVQCDDKEVLKFDRSDPNYGGPDESGNVTNIDRRDPITHWHHLSAALNEALGMQIGLVHNFIITKLFTDPEYNQIDMSNQNELVMQITQIMHDFDIIETMAYGIYGNCDNIEYITSQIKDTLCNYDLTTSDVVEDMKEDLKNRFIDLEEYYEIAAQLETASLHEYVNQYSLIIDRAYRDGYFSEMETIFINGSISVGYYSRMLWKNYLPDPELTDIRIVYDTIQDVWICDVKSNLFFDDSYVCYGIPHFVQEQLMEIYFYKSEINDYWANSSAFDEFIEKGGFMTGDNTELWWRLNCTSMFINLENQHEYLLQEVPKANKSIYCIHLY